MNKQKETEGVSTGIMTCVMYQESDLSSELAVVVTLSIVTKFDNIID